MKTKRGARELNPTDAYRKKARQREIKRNKAERTYIRDAFGKAQNTSKLTELKNELEELIKIEQTGELNKLQKLRKRVVLEAYEVAVRKKKVGVYICVCGEREWGEGGVCCCCDRLCVSGADSSGSNGVCVLRYPSLASAASSECLVPS